MKMKTAWLVLLMLTIGIGRVGAQTVSGTVRDAATGETLIGATIYDENSGKGTVTNVYGRYTLTLKEVGAVKLRYSFTGYGVEYREMELKGDAVVDVKLDPSISLDEVTVVAERVTSPRSSQMSAIDVPVEHIKMVPVLFGEADVLKALQLLPGVKGGTEGMSGIYVRGGGPDENLFLLDGVPLYNVNHLAGFFSAFNSDAIKNVTLYKGSFPAHFAGRISSVLDITTNDGNDKEYHGGASIGLLAAKVNLEGPIVKEKTTFSLSARRTYGDVLMMPLMSALSLMDGATVGFGYHFYDLNAKVVHKFNQNSRLYASFYKGDDVLKLNIALNDWGGMKSEMGMGYNWGNTTAALRWNYVLNPRLFMNVTGSYTQYRNDLTISMKEDAYMMSSYYVMDMKMTYNSGISDLTGRVDFDYTPSPEHNVRFGGALTHHRFSPEVSGLSYHMTGSGDLSERPIDTLLGGEVIYGEEMMLYAEDDYAVSDALKLNAGLALSGFVVEGKPYFRPQPRLSGRFMLTDDLSIKAGYSYMAQYLHLLSSSNVSLPTDLWVPVTSKISPMTSHQVATGVFYSWRSIIDFSVEGYYKWMNNLMEYRNGSSFWGGSGSWQDKVCLGRGWAYGVEFLAQKTIGDITGWVGYTWSRTWRQFDELNEGTPFPAKYDRVHDVSVMMMYKPNDRIDVSAAWVYATGNRATLALQDMPSDSYSPSSYVPDFSPMSGLFGDWSSYGIVEQRNNYRMPAYHRLDVSVNFHKKMRYGKRTISISVYNAYNRKNPFSIYKNGAGHTTVGDKVYSGRLMQISLFPILPSVAYIYKF